MFNEFYEESGNSLQKQSKMEHLFQSVAMDNAEISFILFSVDMWKNCVLFCTLLTK